MYGNGAMTGTIQATTALLLKTIRQDLQAVVFVFSAAATGAVPATIVGLRFAAAAPQTAVACTSVFGFAFSLLIRLIYTLDFYSINVIYL